MKLLPQKPFGWLLLAVVVYAYLTYPKDNYVQTANIPPTENNSVVKVYPDKKEPGFIDKPINKIVQEFSKTDTGKAFVRALAEDQYKKKYGDKDISTINAQESNNLLTMDILKGEGLSAICGSTVTVNYQSFNDVNLPLDSNKDKKPLTFKIGNKQVIKGLENGIVGMKKGGTRKIAIPSRLAYDDPAFKTDLAAGSPVMFEVELLDVKNGFDSEDTLEIENAVSGTGDNEALCGSDVSLTYKILLDSPEYESGALSFRIGNGNVPIGLEKGVMYMKTGGVRKLLIPQSLQKIVGESIMPENIKLPESGNFRLEIMMVSIN